MKKNVLPNNGLLITFHLKNGKRDVKMMFLKVLLTFLKREQKENLIMSI